MSLPFPPLNIPFTDRNSQMTSAWRNFLEEMSRQIDIQGGQLIFNTDKVELTGDADTIVFNPDNDLYLNGIKYNNPTDADQVLQYLNGEYSWVSTGSLSNDAPTGAIRINYEDSAPSGWVTLDDGTLGSSDSLADHNDDSYETLYKLIWDNISDTYCPVTGGRLPSAQQDWDANKPIALPQVAGRVIKGSSTMGKTEGVESFVMDLDHLPLHSHAIPNATIGPGATSGGTGIRGSYPDHAGIYAGFGVSFYTSLKGTSDSQNVIQPTSFTKWVIKV